MRIDQVENLVSREVTNLLEDMAREAAEGKTRVEGCLLLDFEAVGVDAGQASAAMQLVAGRVR